jgi:hypothetical protein
MRHGQLRKTLKILLEQSILVSQVPDAAMYYVECPLSADVRGDFSVIKI